MTRTENLDSWDSSEKGILTLLFRWIRSKSCTALTSRSNLRTKTSSQCLELVNVGFQRRAFITKGLRSAKQTRTSLLRIAAQSPLSMDSNPSPAFHRAGSLRKSHLSRMEPGAD